MTVITQILLVPLVFWLQVTYNGNGITVYPVPFSSYEDCVTAGKQATNYNPNSRIFTCVQQRKADVRDWIKDNGSINTFMDGQ